MRPTARAISTALTVVFLLASASAQAATPASGTLSKPGQKLSWTGSFQATTLEAKCDVVDVCDHFALTLKMGEGARVKVQIPAPNPATDVDFAVYDPKGVQVAKSVNFPGEDESATFTHKAKFRNMKYDVAVAPYLVVPRVTTYKATASVSKYVK